MWGIANCILIFISLRILEILDALTASYPISENEASATLNMISFSVTTSRIDPTMFAGFEFTPPSDPISAVSPSSNFTLPAVSLSIPSTLFDDVVLPEAPGDGDGLPRISNIVYNTDTLFLESHVSNSRVALSVVASATLSVGSRIAQVSNLDPPIILIFAKKYYPTTEISCNFWNFDSEF